MWERSVFLGVSHSTTARRAVHQRSQFWGSLLFMLTPFAAELPNLTWLHNVRKGVFLPPFLETGGTSGFFPN